MLLVPHSDGDAGQQLSSQVDPREEDLGDVLLHLLVIQDGDRLLVLQEFEGDLDHGLLLDLLGVEDAVLEVVQVDGGVRDAFFELFDSFADDLGEAVVGADLADALGELFVLEEFGGHEHLDEVVLELALGVDVALVFETLNFFGEDGEEGDVFGFDCYEGFWNKDGYQVVIII